MFSKTILALSAAIVLLVLLATLGFALDIGVTAVLLRI
jgi:hypothetical protein